MAVDDDDFELTLPANRDKETLEKTCEEARTALDHQIDLLRDMDDKAMRSVRITLLTLGIFLSASAFPGSLRFFNLITISGVGSLVISILFGLITYSASEPSFGIGKSYAEEIRTTAYTEEEGWKCSLRGTRNGVERWTR